LAIPHAFKKQIEEQIADIDALKIRKRIGFPPHRAAASSPFCASYGPGEKAIDYSWKPGDFEKMR
jgi:hypothetical protein